MSNDFVVEYRRGTVRLVATVTWSKPISKEDLVIEFERENDCKVSKVLTHEESIAAVLERIR